MSTNRTKVKMIFSLLIILVLMAILWSMGQSDWHLNRNVHNEIPKGEMKFVEEGLYKDTLGLLWELQPPEKNLFHQPDERIAPVDNPYPNIEYKKPIDLDNPNLKFLSKLDNGGSYEAILQPDGNFLESGKKQGTYNYGDPSGFIGTAKHVLWDVLPHFVNSNYQKP